MGGAMGMALSSALRFGNVSLLLDWGEDLLSGWSAAMKLDIGFEFVTVLCCDGCAGLDARTEAIIVGALVEVPLPSTGESSEISSTVTFGRGFVGGTEDCGGRTEVALMIS